MQTQIFTKNERKILEAYLTNSKVNKAEATKIINKIKTEKILFDDVFLYLQAKKTIST
jgi:hypothetical protein